MSIVYIGYCSDKPMMAADKNLLSQAEAKYHQRGEQLKSGGSNDHKGYGKGTPNNHWKRDKEWGSDHHAKRQKWGGPSI